MNWRHLSLKKYAFLLDSFIYRRNIFTFYNQLHNINFHVRFEHILKRIVIISEAARTETRSIVTINLFIGGVISARFVYTLIHLRITHILCLCSNDIGQSNSQFPNIFTYKNFSINHLVSSILPSRLFFSIGNLAKEKIDSSLHKHLKDRYIGFVHSTIWTGLWQ